jgi:hypothetical protein
MSASCKKCKICSSECVQVYTYDTTVKKYDTLCSVDFPDWDRYIDTVNWARGGYINIISTNTFSSCGASIQEINKARCQ